MRNTALMVCLLLPISSIALALTPKRPSGACNRRVSASVEAIGGFAHDRGCILSHFLVDGKRYERGKATQAALSSMGWKKATEKKRRDLVRTWVLSGLFGYEGTILKTRPKRRGLEKFAPPKVSITKQGYRVTMWVRGPTGMRCGNYFSAHRVDIDRHGKLLASKETVGFFKPC